MKHKDQEELLKRAAELKDVVAVQAEHALEAAQELTKKGVRTAAPRVMDAVNKSVKTASPLVDQATGQAARLTHQAGDALDHVHKDLVGVYLPRLQDAVEEATAYAATEAKRIGAPVVAPVIAAIEVETTKRTRGRRFRQGLGWSALAAGAAGVGYLLWRRSKPIEDPWAEEYWADLETDVDVSEIPTEVADAAADVTESVEDAVDQAADVVEEKAEQVAEAVEDSVDEAKDN